MMAQAQPLEQLIPAVQEMLAVWPHGVDVLVDVAGHEVAIDAEAWLPAAAGQWLHERLGGVEQFVGIFRYARRRVPVEVGA